MAAVTQPDLSLVVPAFNEEARLPAMLRHSADYLRRRGLNFEIIVVDDGSTDRTCEVVGEFGELFPEIRAISLDRNRGKGHAVRTGVLQTRGGLVLVADADNSTPITELERLEPAVREGADIAIGSRALKADDVHLQVRWHRKAIGLVFRGFVALLGTAGIHDTQCGFKLFEGMVARDLFGRSRIDGFAFDVEILLLAQRERLSIREIPVDWVHQDGSRINLATDSLRMLGDLIRIRSRVLLDNFPWSRP